MATDKGIALTNKRCTVLFDNCTKYPRISNKRCFDSQVSPKCLHHTPVYLRSLIATPATVQNQSSFVAPRISLKSEDR